MKQPTQIVGKMIEMVSLNQVFSLVYRTAECFVPTDELTREQIIRLDEISIKPCRCTFCRNKKYAAHVSPVKLMADPAERVSVIGWSRPYWSDLISGKIVMDATLLDAIGTILHEIIHVLFPDYNEKQVRKKTCRWLKRNQWFEFFKKMQDLPVSELEKLGYKM